MGHHTPAYAAPTPTASMITNLQPNFYAQPAQQQQLNVTKMAHSNTPTNASFAQHLQNHTSTTSSFKKVEEPQTNVINNTSINNSYNSYSDVIATRPDITANKSNSFCNAGGVRDNGSSCNFNKLIDSC